MSTVSSQLEAVVLAAINQEGKLNVAQIYELVSQAINLTDEDHQLIIVSGTPTEQAWHRNVRNVLQHLKQKGKLLNQPKGFWQLPVENETPKISVEFAWDATMTTASACFSRDEIWYSPIEFKEYKISRLNDNSIEIERLSGGENTRLSKIDLKRAVNVVNASGGRVARRSLNRVVAKEAAIVFFHPELSYDSDGQFIIVEDLTTNDFINRETATIVQQEAKNDNPQEFANVLRRVRKGQSQLRHKLLQVYESQCCMTGTGPINVLEAAHIENHSIGGINLSTNALLLRSDIHILYDDYLIAIHPETLTIYVSQELMLTSYWALNGTLLKPRNDGKYPEIKKLLGHWGQKAWIPLEPSTK